MLHDMLEADPRSDAYRLAMRYADASVEGYVWESTAVGKSRALRVYYTVSPDERAVDLWSVSEA